MRVSSTRPAVFLVVLLLAALSPSVAARPDDSHKLAIGDVVFSADGRGVDVQALVARSLGKKSERDPYLLEVLVEASFAEPFGEKSWNGFVKEYAVTNHLEDYGGRMIPLLPLEVMLADFPPDFRGELIVRVQIVLVNDRGNPVASTEDERRVCVWCGD